MLSYTFLEIQEMLFCIVDVFDCFKTKYRKLSFFKTAVFNNIVFQDYVVLAVSLGIDDEKLSTKPLKSAINPLIRFI